MKFIQKYFYMIALSVFLLAGAVFVGMKADLPILQLSASIKAQPYFYVANPDGSETERVTIFDAGDGNCYVFLPSYAEMERVTVAAGKGQQFTLDGVELTEGLNCGDFRLDTPYTFASDGEYMAELQFLRSENMAAMYIDTVSGNLEGILHDTYPEETASARLYTAAGDRDLLDEYAAIKCRGYSSWNFDKKSYTLSLRQSKDLLDMGISEKWTLTANGYDETHLRNKTVYSFADSVAPYSAWSPDCAPIELYLNGEYAGLYLLCQKPDAGPDHFNLPPEDYYLEMMPAARVWDPSTMAGICSSELVQVKFPKNCNVEAMDYLQNFMTDFHTALIAEEGTQWLEYIDLDSWARKYLIEEVFSNCDGGRISSFCWLDTSEGKLYTGHCWDYDHAVGYTATGMWDSTYSLLAQRDWTYDTSWFGALCQKEEFMVAVERLYVTEFRPLLLEYAERTIPAFAEDIRYVIPSEYLRWPALHGDAGWNASVESVITFVQERVAFLDALWLEKAEFFEISDGISNTYVRAGAVCENLPLPFASVDGIWYLAGTDIPFDVTQPVTCDIRLSATPTVELPPETALPENEESLVVTPFEKKENAATEAADTSTKSIRDYIDLIAKTADNFTTQELITMLSVVVLTLLLLCFVCVDFFQRKKDRRKADAPSRRKVSS